MNKLLFLSAFLMFSCTSLQENYYELLSDKNPKQTHILLNKGSIGLPTRCPMPDSIYVQKDFVIAEQDLVMGPEGQELTIYSKGDTLNVPGDTIRKEKETILYTTELTIHGNEFQLVSDKMLERCQLNLEYKSNCVYSKLFKRFRSSNNVGLDFSEEKDGKYIYKASFDKWISGSYDELDYALLIYTEQDTPFSRTSNEIYFSKEDIDSLLKPFKAYLKLK